MAISIRKYVDITSAVGGASTVTARELILRIFSPKAPAGAITECTELEDVARLFGTTSEEYKRSVIYFSFISKLATRASKISFAHLSAKSEPSPASILGGNRAETDIDKWNEIRDGALRLSVDGETIEKVLDFSKARSLSGVAEMLSQAFGAAFTAPPDNPTIKGKGDIDGKKAGDVIPAADLFFFRNGADLKDILDIKGDGISWDGKNVTIAPEVRTMSIRYQEVKQTFSATFTNSTPPTEIILLDATQGKDIREMLGWTETQGVTISPGQAAGGPLPSVIEADSNSDNYAAFMFVDILPIEDVLDIAAWNSAQNVKYMYLVSTLLANYVTNYEKLRTYAGTAITLVRDEDDYADMIPGIILAATNYNLRNASQDYMYQMVPGISASVTDNALATRIDKTRVNYYGRTKTAGQQLEFYQNGYLCGGQTAPVTMTVYANEIWFKSAATVAFMEMLLALPILPTTSEGRATVLGVLQQVIDVALYNGTITIDKTLTAVQKAYIQTISGDPLAWHQIQSIGYWVDAVITQSVHADGVTLYQIDYTLIYSKSDAVHKITGRHILI